MKKTILTLLASGTLIASPAVIIAQNQPAKEPGYKQEASNERIVGTVKEKKEHEELTVTEKKGGKEEDNTVKLTSTTTYKKDGQAATEADVEIGSRVMIKLKKGDSGNEALEVLVLGSTKKPLEQK